MMKYYNNVISRKQNQFKSIAIKLPVLYYPESRNLLLENFVAFLLNFLTWNTYSISKIILKLLYVQRKLL